MSWSKAVLNGAGVVANGTSVNCNLQGLPPRYSVIIVSACFTGNPGTIYGVGDGFNTSGSWVQISQQVNTDQFGNAITYCNWYRILNAGPGAQALISVSCSNPCNIGANSTCWLPDEATDGSYVYGTARPNSGVSSQPVPSPEVFPSVAGTGLSFSMAWNDGNIADGPVDPTWSLQAAAAAGTPQYGTIELICSNLNSDGSGSGKWNTIKQNWSCTGQQFSYTKAPGPPIITANPVITGTPTLGVASSYTPGSANANGGTTPTVTSQRWYVAGVQVATTATYTPVVGDVGKALTVQVTWTNNVGTTNANSPGKTVATAAGGPWTVGQAAFIFFQDTAALTTVGSFAATPTANSVVWCAAVCRSGTAGAGITCAVTDNFGDTGGTPWQLVQSANAQNDTTFVFWRIRGTGGTGRAMTATWGGPPSSGISRSSVTGFNYTPPGVWATVEMVDSKTYNTPTTTPTTMPNFAALDGDFLLSYLAISGSTTSTPVAFTSVIQGVIAGTGTTNGHGAIRNVAAGAVQNPNFTFTTGTRVCLVAGQFRIESAPPPGLPRSSAWLGYVAGQGGV